MLLATTVVSAADSSNEATDVQSDTHASTIETSDQTSDNSDSSSQATTSSNTQTTTNTHSSSDTASSTSDTTSAKTTSDTSSSNTNTQKTSDTSTQTTSNSDNTKTSDTQTTSTQTTTKDTTSSQSSVSDVETSSSDIKEANNTLTAVSSNLVDEKTQLKTEPTVSADGLTYTAYNYDDLVSAVNTIKTEGTADETYSILLGDGSTEEVWDITETITWGDSGQTATKLIIDGQKLVTLNGNEQHQFMTISDNSVTLQNITITNCYSTNEGGAIYINNGENTIEIKNSTFTNNKASDNGGAIHVDSGKISIENCDFQSNTANEYGGAIYNSGGDLTIIDSTFSKNTANSMGGAIYIQKSENGENGETSITGSEFTENSADHYGGAITVENSILSLEKSFFNNNEANFLGGAIHGDHSTIKISNSEFSGNNAPDGGAITLDDDGTSTITITNTDFKGNTATYGGAIFNVGGNLEITSATFEENEASYGGAIFNEGGNLKITETTFEGNIGRYGGAINNEEDSYLTIKEETTFKENEASYGGAIYNNINSIVSLEKTTFQENSATYDGGAIYNPAGTITISDSSKFIENSASRNGGAIYNFGIDETLTATLTISNSEFRNNTATTGGAIYNYGSSSLTLTGNTFESKEDEDQYIIYTTVETNSIDGNIKVPDYECKVGETLTMYSPITDSSKTDQYLTFNIYKEGSDELIESLNPVIDDDGYYYVDYEFPSTGIYTVKITYDTQEDAISFNVDVTSETLLKLNEVDDTTPENTIEITGTLTEEDGTPITDYKDIIIYIMADGEVLKDDTGDYLKISINDKGEFSFDYTTVLGFNEISAIFTGNDIYEGSYDIIKFEAQQNETKISIHEIEDPILINQEVTIYFDLIDKTSSTETETSYIILTDLDEFYVTVDGKEITEIESCENGTYSFTYTPTTTDEHYIFVEYYGNATYTRSEVTNLINPTTINTSISIDVSPININPTDEITISGQVTYKNENNEDQPVSGGTVTLYINDETVAIEVNDVGSYEFSYLTTTNETIPKGYINVKLGDNKVKVEYTPAESSTYSSATSEEKELNVAQNKAEFKYVEITETEHVGQDVEISGQLVDEEGNGIAYAEIIITVNNEVKGSTFTDENGFFTYSYVATTVGSEEIRISFIGNEKYTLADDGEKTEVGEDDTVIIPTTSTYETTYGSSVTISGHLEDELGNSIANAEVYLVDINENPIASATTTDKYGYFEITYTPETAGEIKVIIKYDGDETTYNGAEFGTITVTVGKAATTTTIESISTDIDGSLLISVYVEDQYGKAVNEGQVSLKINDEDYVDESGEIIYEDVTDGYATFKYSDYEAGESLIFQAFYQGSENYAESQSEEETDIIDKLISILTVGKTEYDLGKGQATTEFTLTYNNEAIPDANEFTVTLNGKELDEDSYEITYDDTEGKYVLTYKIESTGDYYLTVTYNGNETYISSEGSTEFRVEKKNVEINIQAESPIKVGETLTATITIKDGDTIIPDGTLTVTVNGETEGVTTTQDTDGTYSITYPTTQDGKYTIIAQYTDLNGNYNNAEEVKVVEVKKIETTVSIDKIDTTNTDNVVITGTLTGDGKNMDGTVSIYINGEPVESNCEVNEGTFTYTYTGNSVYGTNTVEVYFEETEVYTSSHATKSYIIDDPNAKTDTTITVSDIADITLGESVTITGSLTCGNNISIGSAQIIITINGNDYNATTDPNGVYTLTDYVPTATGNYTVVVQYDGDTTYNPSHNSTTFNVEIVPTTITLVPIENIKFHDSTTISGVLEDSEGNILADQDVTISLNGTVIETRTNNTGGFSYTFTPDQAGSYSVVVDYTGTGKYASSQAVSSLLVKPLYTNITVANVTGFENETVDLIAYIVDENGDPVSEGKVAFKLNEVTLKDEDGEVIYVDVVNGVATLPYTIINTAKNYTITGLYYGTDNYNNAKTEENGILEVKKTSMNTRVLVNDTTAQYGDTIELAALVLDEDGNIVTSGKVVFKLNGVSLKYENGDVIYVPIGEDGYARYTYTITNNPKLYTVTAVYSGDGYYITSRNTTATLNVTNRVVDMTVDSVTGKSGDTITLKATITEDDNTYTDNGVVVFKLNGVTIRDDNGDSKKVNVVDGVAELEYEIPVDMAGKDYNITAVYSNKNYDRAEANNTLTVERSEVKTSITPLTTTKGSDTTITTVLYDENGNQLERSTKVAIKINGKTVVHTTTENGVLNVTIPTEELSKGDYNIEVVFGENSAYYEKRLNTTLTIV